ncbi:MAG: nucleotidyltransferase family protein [Pseudomonadota bacterium]
MTKLTAVVLAAGMSRRMGRENKLLLPVNGRPMIVRTLCVYLDVCDDVVVVTGFEADRIRAAIGHLDVDVVHNPDFANGQATSVAVGLRKSLGSDTVMVGLGDQPSLRSSHLDALIQSHIGTGAQKVTIPCNRESRGNPIVIPKRLVGKMLEDKQNPGCGKFTRQRRDLVDLVPFSETAFFHDVDTPEDYAALSNPFETTETVQ